MLITQQTMDSMKRWQGSRGDNLAEMRERLADPSRLDDDQQKRLLDLAQRLDRIQSLGGEYARVEFSEFSQCALEEMSSCEAI